MIVGGLEIRRSFRDLVKRKVGLGRPKTGLLAEKKGVYENEIHRTSFFFTITPESGPKELPECFRKPWTGSKMRLLIVVPEELRLLDLERNFRKREFY